MGVHINEAWSDDPAVYTMFNATNVTLQILPDGGNLAAGKADVPHCIERL